MWSKEYRAHQFHISNNSLQDSFLLFASKNPYAEARSLLAIVVKSESSKLSSILVLSVEESTFSGTWNNCQLAFNANKLEHAIAN